MSSVMMRMSVSMSMFMMTLSMRVMMMVRLSWFLHCWLLFHCNFVNLFNFFNLLDCWSSLCNYYWDRNNWCRGRWFGNSDGLWSLHRLRSLDRLWSLDRLRSFYFLRGNNRRGLESWFRGKLRLFSRFRSELRSWFWEFYFFKLSYLDSKLFVLSSLDSLFLLVNHILDFKLSFSF